MVMRPVILSPSFRAFRSLSSCTASAVGLNESCAAAGYATTNSSANAAHKALRIEALWAAALGTEALRVECELAIAERPSVSRLRERRRTTKGDDNCISRSANRYRP